MTQYPDVPLAQWCKTYSLPETTDPCPVCGADRPGKPILTDESAGVEWQCECKGDYSTAAILTPVTEEAKAFWKSVVEFFHGAPTGSDGEDEGEG
jgi:hypothetical protein